MLNHSHVDNVGSATHFAGHLALHDVGKSGFLGYELLGVSGLGFQGLESPQEDCL